MVIAFVLAIFLIPLWTTGTTILTLAIGSFLMQFMVQGAWGIIPAHLTELAPDSVRGFLPGFAYQCGVLIASNSAHLQTQFARNGDYATTMSIMALVVFIIGSIVILLGPERRAVHFGS
jgi:SHS family lactate transporter-like MFS transporter